MNKLLINYTLMNMIDSVIYIVKNIHNDLTIDQQYEYVKRIIKDLSLSPKQYEQTIQYLDEKINQ